MASGASMLLDAPDDDNADHDDEADENNDSKWHEVSVDIKATLAHQQKDDIGILGIRVMLQDR